MEYSRYKASRDAAWQILIDHAVDSLPVQVSALCKPMGIALISIQSAQAVIDQIIPPDYIDQIQDGFAAILQGRPHIFYNANGSHGRNRFTVAHELGHIIMGHLSSDPQRITFRAEPKPFDDSQPMEREANVFASRLLAPAGVLLEIGVSSPEEIATLCDISAEAAGYRWERLKILRERDARFRAERGHGTVGMSPLERQILKQFEEFIEANRR